MGNPPPSPPAPHARPRLAVAFTGGKDSTLAVHLLLHRPDLLVTALALGGRTPGDPGCPPPGLHLGRLVTDPAPQYDVVALVTFHPPAPRFLSHPLAVVQAQAAAMRLPLRLVEVRGPDYAAAYARAITQLGVDCLVTGDMLDVGDGFMARACAAAQVHMWCPLWHVDRHLAWRLVLGTLRLEPVVTCVHVRKFLPSWGHDRESTDDDEKDDPTALYVRTMDRARRLVGRTITPALFHDTLAPTAAHGIDLGGEAGEFHTMVVNGPLFTTRVALPHGLAQLDPTGEYLYYDMDGPPHAAGPIN